MLSTKSILILLVVFALVLVASNQTHQQPKPATPKAAWSEDAQAITGLTEAEFRSAGLYKLTPQEFLKLVDAMAIHQSAAATNAVKYQTQYKCGPFTPDLDRVKIYISTSDKTPSEVASGIRQRLRAMPDVTIVYSETDADLGLEIVGMADELVSGRISGYTAAVFTYDGCEATLGDTKWPAQMQRNLRLQATGTTNELIESIVTTIDTNDIESVRKTHATIKKLSTQK